MVAVLFIVLVFVALVLTQLTEAAQYRQPFGQRMPFGRRMRYDGGDDDVDGGDDCEVIGGARPFRLSIREPWFDAMIKGKKVVDGRLRRGAFADDAAHPLKVGDPITVARSRPAGDTTEYPGNRSFNAKIVRLTKYKTFAELLKAEGVAKVLPGMKTDKEAIATLSAFHEAGDEEQLGVVAIEISIE